ncbi:hypothetical protein GE09DRAFT_1022165 [Coniochaeta sp. 2T2.1]|nr:hypothetical protein GE09DRAFT_1022165 [Coniochaeta sp. 2T2.1]
MSNNTIYLVTGTNRGIGKHIVSALVQRPSTTVIATLRDPSFTFTDISTHPTSKLVPIVLNDKIPEISYASLPFRLSLIVDHIDIVIANAGYASGFRAIQNTDIDDIVTDLQVNTIGVVKLFSAVQKLLLSEGRKGEKKFVLISSNLASIGGRPEVPSASYSISKAAANQFARMASVEFRGEGLSVGIFHPGWVRTAMGHDLADVLNRKEPPLSAEESAARIIELTDKLDLETSGKFLDSQGQELPW